MYLILYFFLFLFGLITGSFLNAVVYRMEKGESFLFSKPKTKEEGSVYFERSYCPKCKHRLSWKDLIPLLSFLFLKGRCRYCNEQISWQYPLVELITGFLFVGIVLHSSNLLFFGNNSLWLWTVFFDLVLACFLIVIFLYDLRSYLIPDVVIYPAIIIAFIYRLCETFGFERPLWSVDVNLQILSNLADPLKAAFGAAAFFLLIVLISRGKWMGIGDIKLAFLMGLFLGFPEILVALFSAFFLGAIIGVGLIVSRKKTLKSEVPFGPFLATGTLIAFFWGNEIISWYLNILSLNF